MPVRTRWAGGHPGGICLTIQAPNGLAIDSREAPDLPLLAPPRRNVAMMVRKYAFKTFTPCFSRW